MVARHEESPLSLIRRAAGGPREIRAKSLRLGRILRGYADRKRLDTRLERLRARGVIETIPTRVQMDGTGGLTLPDVQRPWRALDFGNIANYDPAIIGGRTSNMPGVVGVWHVDVGNTGAGAGQGVGWTPLAGSSSAWMGMRRHGDVTAIDDVARGGLGLHDFRVKESLWLARRPAPVCRPKPNQLSGADVLLQAIR